MFTTIKGYIYGILGSVIVLVGLYCAYLHMHCNALTLSLKQTTLSLKNQSEQMNVLIKQRENLQNIDNTHTKALANAQHTINSLGVQLTSGQRQLHIKNAIIYKLSQASSSGSVGDATTCGLNRTGEQDYLALLEMIAKQRQQILYLQDYAKAVSQ
ncbi:hypothetical protein COMNV_00453 [Commensalibacter sp. Nvir]|uniref:lysis system i-spanin subunit Rz n=1 Tax=Commensalibacter sp. Nvir TaxID=3069817 RepID=UPI002D3F419D|nr:hypothetical protein COMNV_00453 [Commensalibacter sp. Nvir]